MLQDTYSLGANVTNQVNEQPNNVFRFLPAKDCKLSMVVAMGLDRAIGERGTMPWYLPADLKHFKQVTLQSCVIMGRRTFESIGRPLPMRRNIVVSSSAQLKERDDIEVVSSFDDALVLAMDKEKAQEHYQNLPKDADVIDCEYQKIFIIGGAAIFEEGLKVVNELIVTQIRASFPCADTHFPDLNQYGHFILQEQKPFINDYKAFYYCKAEQPNGFAQEISEFDEDEVLVDEQDNIMNVENTHNGLAFSYLIYERIS